MSTKSSSLAKYIDKLLSFVPGGSNDISKLQLKTEFLGNTEPQISDMVTVFNPTNSTYWSSSIEKILALASKQVGLDETSKLILESSVIQYPYNGNFIYDSDKDGLADNWYIEKSDDAGTVSTYLGTIDALFKEQNVSVSSLTNNDSSYVELYQIFPRNFLESNFVFSSEVRLLGPNSQTIRVSLLWSLHKDGPFTSLFSKVVAANELINTRTVTVIGDNLPDAARFIRVSFKLEGSLQEPGNLAFSVNRARIWVTESSEIKHSGIDIYNNQKSFLARTSMTFEDFQVSSIGKTGIKISNPSFKLTGIEKQSLVVRSRELLFPTSTVKYGDTLDITSKLEVIPKISMRVNDKTITYEKFFLESGFTIDEGTGDLEGYGILSTKSSSFTWLFGADSFGGLVGTADTIEIGDGLIAKEGISKNRVHIEVEPSILSSLNKQVWLSSTRSQTLISARDDSPDFRSAVWFGNSMLPLPMTMVGDKDGKAIMVTPAPGKDRQQFLVLFDVNFHGHATSDGAIRILVKDRGSGDGHSNEVFLKDVDGTPLAIEKQFQSNDLLGELTVAGIVELDSSTALSFHIVHTFEQWISLSNFKEAPSVILIQAIDNVSEAIYEYERLTGKKITWYIHEYLNPIASLEPILKNNLPRKTYGDATNAFTRNFFTEGSFHLFPVNESVDLLVYNGVMRITDTPLAKEMPLWYLGHAFEEDETSLLRGKEVEITATLGRTNEVMSLFIAYWDGVGEIKDADNLIVAARNENPVYGANWHKIGETLFPEIVSGQQVLSTRAKIPSNARMVIAGLMYFMESIPLECEIISMDVNVHPEFQGAILDYIKPKYERFLSVGRAFNRYVQDNQSFDALRYTINADYSPCPIGILLGEKNVNIETDPSVNIVLGSRAKGGEGGFLFPTETNNVDVNTTVYIYPGENLQGSSEVTFSWFKILTDGTEVEFPNGTFKTTVWKGAAPKSFSFDIRGDFAAGEKLILKMKSQGADYAYIQSTSARLPLIENIISADTLF